jgi:hypothetical protein
MNRSTPLRRRKGLRSHGRRRLGWVGCGWTGCNNPLAVSRWCRQHATIMADRAVKQFILDRDGCCFKCGTTRDLLWSHVFSRRARSIRWDPRNSFAMCGWCELWATEHPGEWRARVEARYPGRLQVLRDLREKAERPDVAAIIERYGSAEVAS